MSKTPTSKSPATKKPSSSRTNVNKATARKAPARSAGGRPAGLFTWVAVGLVVIVVAALVVIKVANGSPSSSTNSAWQAADPTVVAQVTGVPASTLDAVGVSSPVVKVYPPLFLKGQPVMTAKSASGATLPRVVYIGAEFCPYCAAQRWSLIIALSRFGTIAKLGNTTSSSVDVDPNTPTFTFHRMTYTSKYIVFKGYELYTRVPDPANNYYFPLEKLSSADFKMYAKYDSGKFVPGIHGQGFPFINFANQSLVAGPMYTSAGWNGVSRNQIAAGLSSPASPITDGILTAANEQTAAICSLTHNQPSAVCTSKGVTAAKKLLKIK